MGRMRPEQVHKDAEAMGQTLRGQEGWPHSYLGVRGIESAIGVWRSLQLRKVPNCW